MPMNAPMRTPSADAPGADAVALRALARYKNGELIIRIPKGRTDNSSGITNIYVY